MIMPRSRLYVLALASALGTSVAGPPAAHAKEPMLLLRAFAVNMAGVGRATAGTIDIGIERWTTDDERAKLFSVLVEKGSDRLLDALHDVKPRAGFVRTSNSLGWDVNFAHEIPLPDGARRILLATDRPMSFWELRNQPRSADYEYTLIEIRLGPDGKGVGKMATAAKIQYDRDANTIQIENYSTEPVRLTQVEVVGSKPKK
jgi:hypothetical protein